MGDYGKVYKGFIDDPTTISVAIKRVNIDSRAGFHELKTELLLLLQLRQSNLVPLIGYCLDHQQMILVYQFIFNGNLGEQLYGTNHDNPLPWKQRLRISIGVARVLHYLHTGLKHTIIHRNVKPSNILLDEKWEPKLADFASYKLGPPSLSKALIRVDSSPYYSVVQSSILGIRLLKTLEQRHLLEWVRKCKREGTINEIVDPYLMGKIAQECFKKYVDIATSCVQKKGKNRPTIGEVEVILEHAMELQESADAARKDVDPGGDHYNYPIVDYTCSAFPPEPEPEESVPDSDITATIWEKF
uniref:non-specific serine/threonine protein kinase n=1 Tax=Quercus lobata TaxID=97700 RepID=A0A7N2LT40_QUELO